MLDTADTRFGKAIALADRSGEWIPLRSNGRCMAVAIPSSQPNRYYRVTRRGCECQDWLRHQPRPCKHLAALEIAIVRRQPELPARAVVDGLAEMVRQRTPKYDAAVTNAVERLAELVVD